MAGRESEAGKAGGRVLRGRADFADLDAKYLILADFLAAQAPGGGLPGEADLELGALSQLHEYLNLADVVRDPAARAGGGPRFRFRWLGAKQTQAAGRDITGLFIEDAVLPAYVERINRNMRSVVETRLPVYDRFPMPHPNRGFLDSERVYYPLAEDGRTVDAILILNGYLELGTGLPMLNY